MSDEILVVREREDLYGSVFEIHTVSIETVVAM